MHHKENFCLSKHCDRKKYKTESAQYCHTLIFSFISAMAVSCSL